MDNTFNMENQCYLPLAQNFCFNSSPDVAFTPTPSLPSAQNESRPWTFNELNAAYHNMSYWIDGQYPSSAFISGATGYGTESLPQHNALHQEFAYMDYQLTSDASTVDHVPASSVRLPSTVEERFDNESDMSPAGSFMASSPEPRSRSASIAPMSSWSCSSPATTASDRRLSDTPSSYGTDDHYHQVTYSLRDSNSICRMESPRSRKGQAGVLVTQPEIIRKAIGQCDYPGCKKSFRRVEHLKRHKQSHHGEGGQNRFSCEFCGKDNFNRYDNLQTHRRLHTRKNKRQRSIKFVPAAVSIIEGEEKAKKQKSGFAATPVKSRPYMGKGHVRAFKGILELQGQQHGVL
ncbi:uncharacterized protein FIESC28_05329 [Fusarium coffeatum]|uniref:C2H2-type domain-containing protein n=1 Tax=Fusarium coffeatum TaxID=231269 RepID=A0A366RVJ9_9HYPO|nr:uncharacterized protein FIESC28_05329 [Fusarium coffeatum]RBR20365.1 hypothetical protein FIESC28_05329 [Fusarium coffeatum]